MEERKTALVHRTITLTEEQYQWLEAHVEVGLFTDISEHIRDLIRRARESHDELEEIRQKLIEGEQSPIVPFDPEEFEKEMIEKYG